MEDIVFKQLQTMMDSLQAIDKAYAEYAKMNGLTYMSLSILEALYEAPNGITQKELCEVCFYNKQTVNMIVTAFHKKGYIVLRELNQDRRHKLVSLSNSGQEYASHVVGKLWKMCVDAVSDFSEEERNQLIHMIKIYKKKFVSEVNSYGSDNKEA